MILTGFSIVLCLGILIIWVIYTYNRFVEKQAKVDKLWDEVDTHLRLRRELIPSLIDTENRRMQNEQPLIEKMLLLCSEIENNDSTDIDERLENEISTLLAQIRDAAQTHPELMTEQTFITLLSELVSAEGRAATACDVHNHLVRDYNKAIKGFPANLIVRFLHFSPNEMRIFGVPHQKQTTGC